VEQGYVNMPELWKTCALSKLQTRSPLVLHGLREFLGGQGIEHIVLG